MEYRLNDGWKTGPLKDVYNWGGVVLHSMLKEGRSDGFYFADFNGDNCRVFMGQKLGDNESDWVTVSGKDVAYYNNNLTLPFVPKDLDKWVNTKEID